MRTFRLGLTCLIAFAIFLSVSQQTCAQRRTDVLNERSSIWRVHKTWRTEVVRKNSGALALVDPWSPRTGKETDGKLSYTVRYVQKSVGTEYPDATWRAVKFDDVTWNRQPGNLQPHTYQALALICATLLHCIACAVSAVDPTVVHPGTLATRFDNGTVLDVDIVNDVTYRVRVSLGTPCEPLWLVLDFEADVAVRNYKGKTALHVAAKSGFVPAMTLLLEHGADANAADPAGETPLFDVIRSTIKRTERKLGAVALLLEHGADVTVKNKKGQTPIDIARAARHPATSEILRLLE